MLDTLTQREVEISELLATGLSTTEIAARLYLSAGTVKWYAKQIYSKLDVHNRVQLVERLRHRPRMQPSVSNPAATLSNNLPAPPTPLIGRDTEVATALELLMQPNTRLLTLIGPPGIGKTRLSIAVAQQLSGRFPDGIFFIDLALIRDAQQVAPLIVETLKLAEPQPQSLAERLKSALRDRHTLLLLDNFEHLLEAAPFVAEWVSACPHLKLLVTSRAPLRIRWERLFAVPALRLPENRGDNSFVEIEQVSAVALFAERAQAIKPDFAVTDENISVIGAICTRLDGLPLAIELISVHIRLLPPHMLLERLTGRLLLASESLRDLEPRHRTLTAAIDWSYNLLTELEQRVFRMLGVFVGGCLLEAVGSVCTDVDEDDLLAILSKLVDQYLVVQAIDRTGESRFSLLETIREYALSKLLAHHELDTLRAHHAEHYLYLTVEAEPELRRQTQITWLNRLEADYDNILAALNFYLKIGKEPQRALQLVAALRWYWVMRGHFIEGQAWIVETLSRHPQRTSLRAQALNTAAALALYSNNFERGATFNHEAQAIAHELHDTPQIAYGLFDSAFLLWLKGDYDEAKLLFDEGSRLASDMRDTWLMAFYDYGAAVYFTTTPGRGDPVLAAQAVERGLAIANRIGERYLTILLLSLQAGLEQASGKLQTAQMLLTQTLTLAIEMEDNRTRASSLNKLAKLALTLDAFPQAARLYAESLNVCKMIDNQGGIVENLAGFASLALAKGDYVRAAHLWSAASKRLEAFLIMPINRAEADSAIVSLREHLGADAFAIAWAYGSAMTQEMALRTALEMA